MATVNGFSVIDAEVPAVLEICRRLDGVPLALELAAARVYAFGVRSLAARLDDRFTMLTNGRRTALPRHQTLRAAVDWSYDLLPEPEQVILQRLAVFQGEFTMDAAAAVASDERFATADVFEGVANLAAKSLVVTDISGDIAYHRLLDTTRAYALEKLTKSGELELIARRHAEYHRVLFQRAEAEWEMRPTSDCVAQYRRHIDDVRAALDWAFLPSGDTLIGVALTAAFVPLWVHLSLLEECRGRVERALSALAQNQAGPPDARCSSMSRWAYRLCTPKVLCPRWGLPAPKPLRLQSSLVKPCTSCGRSRAFGPITPQLAGFGLHWHMLRGSAPWLRTAPTRTIG